MPRHCTPHHTHDCCATSAGIALHIWTARPTDPRSRHRPIRILRCSIPYCSDHYPPSLSTRQDKMATRRRRQQHAEMVLAAAAAAAGLYNAILATAATVPQCNGASKRPGTLQMGSQMGDRTAQQYNTRGCCHVQNSRAAPHRPHRPSASPAPSSRTQIGERAAASVAGVGLAAAAGAAVGTTVCGSASSPRGQTRTLRCRSYDRTCRLLAMCEDSFSNICPRTRSAVCEGLCVAAQVTVPARQRRSDCTAATSSRKEDESILQGAH